MIVPKRQDIPTYILLTTIHHNIKIDSLTFWNFGLERQSSSTYISQVRICSLCNKVLYNVLPSIEWCYEQWSLWNLNLRNPYTTYPLHEPDP